MSTPEDMDSFFEEMRDYVKSQFEKATDDKTAPSPGKKEDAPPAPPDLPKETPKKKRWGFFPEES